MILIFLNMLCLLTDLGRDSPTLKLSNLGLWLALFQGKTLLEEKTVIVELGESWTYLLWMIRKTFLVCLYICSKNTLELRPCIYLTFLGIYIISLFIHHARPNKIHSTIKTWIVFTRRKTLQKEFNRQSWNYGNIHDTKPDCLRFLVTVIIEEDQ